MLKKSYRVIIALFLSVHCFAQDINKDFEEIITKMESSESYAIEVDVKVYDRKGGSLITSTSAALDKMNANSRNKVGEIENLDTEEYALKIDHEEKAILVLKKEKVDKAPKTEKVDFDIKAFQEFLKANTAESKVAVALLSESNGIKNYEITGIHGLKSMKIQLDMNTKRIVDISYEYGGENTDQKNFIRLKYSDFNYGTDLSSTFDLSKYFTLEINIYKVGSSFTGYTIYTEE